MFSRITQIFNNPLQLLYTLPGIIIGLTVHEWAHAYAAYRLGDPTAHNLGRMTLNPFAHIDIFGFLCLLFVGFGWAKPVPVNPRNFKHFKRDDIIVSLAGITTNLIVAFLFTFALYMGAYKFGLGGNEAFVSIFSGIVIINLSLMIFNLIPIYPLDGSHVLESLLIRKIPRFFMFMRQYGQLILMILLITGALSGLLSSAVSGIYHGFSTVAIAILNLF
ncbi:MAG: site-2 protease family protein [Clostridia bacterium]